MPTVSAFLPSLPNSITSLFFFGDLLEGTWVRDSVLSYLSPSTGLLPGGGQDKPSFWDSLPRAEYGLFPPGTVYILWEAAIRHAQKVTL